MKVPNILLFVLHLFVGIGAIVGGLSGLLNPINPLGVSVDLLNNSPFNDFFIPCLLLFVILGCGNIFSALMFKFKTKYQGYISIVFSFSLIIWILVQCIMLRTIIPLHVIFFVIGIIQIVLSATLIFNQKLFPTNIIINWYKAKENM